VRTVGTEVALRLHAAWPPRGEEQMTHSKFMNAVQKPANGKSSSSKRISRAMERVERAPRPARTALGTARGKQRYQSPELGVWRDGEQDDEWLDEDSDPGALTTVRQPRRPASEGGTSRRLAEEAEWAEAIRQAKVSGNRTAWQPDQPPAEHESGAQSLPRATRVLPATPPGARPPPPGAKPPGVPTLTSVPPGGDPAWTDAVAAAAAPAIAPPPAAADTDLDSPYHEYEALGLSPKKEKRSGGALALSKLVVTTYRGLGFLILTLVVAILVSYIGTSIFYFVNSSWVQPMVVSPTDERVLQLNTKLAEQASARDRLVAELNHTERFIAVQEAFQAEYGKAVESDLAERKASLERVRKLADTYAGARREIQRSNSAFAAHSRSKMEEEYSAGLIDRDDFLSGNHRIAQMQHSNLSLVERQAEFESRAASLTAEARALDAALARGSKQRGLSYEVLRIKQDYELSLLETQKARETRDALAASIERYEGMLEGIRQSPYLRAAEQRATVAFVPYDNLSSAQPGTVLYGCELEMLRCRPVGKILDVLPGEVTHKHPHREKLLRGQLMQLELDEPGAAERNVLFAGKAPLLF
jgi:hypothetical protein